MKLSNFEQYIDPVILERGKDYFEKDHVQMIEEIDQGDFLVDVVGTKEYSVEIILDEDDSILHSSCDCPYDYGEYCKHQVAAFYALREYVQDQPTPVKKSKKQKKPDLKKLLTSLKKDELINIILNVCEEYPEMKERLLFTYAPSEDVINSSKKLIIEYINRYTEGGFIHWDDVNDALYGANLTLEKAKERVERGEIETAISLCLVILPIVIDMLDYCDDSSGYAGVVIEECLQTIYNAISMNKDQIGEQLKEELFSLLMEEARNQYYEGWSDWRFELFSSAMLCCDTLARRSRLEKELHQYLESNIDSWSYEYKNKQVKLLQYELIREFDGEDAAFQFVQENMYMSTFREMAIEYYFNKKNYEEVIRICEEGKVVDKDKFGLVSQWKEYELQAYECLNNIEKQKQLMMEFLYANHFEYYAKLKKLYQPDEWKFKLQKILETMENSPRYSSTYINILKEEKLTEKILDYCWNNLAAIQELYPYLIEKHKDEVNKIFTLFIEFKAENSKNRSHYQQVCMVIKQYKKICGKKNAQLLIDRLKQKYARRPAFVDELQKVR